MRSRHSYCSVTLEKEIACKSCLTQLHVQPRGIFRQLPTPFAPVLLCLLMIVVPPALSQPSFTLQPPNQTATLGFGAIFRATATTTSPPLSYQWFFNS